MKKYLIAGSVILAGCGNTNSSQPAPQTVNSVFSLSPAALSVCSAGGTIISVSQATNNNVVQ